MSPLNPCLVGLFSEKVSKTGETSQFLCTRKAKFLYACLYACQWDHLTPASFAHLQPGSGLEGFVLLFCLGWPFFWKSLKNRSKFSVLTQSKCASEYCSWSFYIPIVRSLKKYHFLNLKSSMSSERNSRCGLDGCGVKSWMQDKFDRFNQMAAISSLCRWWLRWPERHLWKSTALVS